MPPQRNFEQRVNHVQPGSPVAASNTSRATRDLEARTNYIKEILDAIEAGRLLVRRAQHIAPDLLEGEAVFWNNETKRYERALAGVVNDSATGSLVTTAASDSIGLLLVKDTPTQGTIGLMGMARVTPTILNNMTGSNIVAPGRYYLSAADPGKLVHQRPPVTVAIAYILGPSDDCETDSWVLILPQMRDFLEDHVHYQFELTARPAGTHIPPAQGEPHVVTNPDVNTMGWLPANHTSFNGAAPLGAKFGYNLAAHTSLSRLWPPIPTEACLLEFHKPDGVDQHQGAVRVMPEHVTFDKHGIWWMTDCYDEVPWPTNYDSEPLSSSLSSGSADSVSSETATDCPLVLQMRLILSFIKMTFATDKTVVTSLQPDDGQPIEYVNCEGQVARTGDLFTRLKILALYAPGEYYGGNILKEIVDGKLSFGRGWVTEGVIAGSQEVVLSSTRRRGLDPTKAISNNNPAVHQGIVTITLQLDPTERELNPQIVRLGDALEREYRDMDYIGFPAGRDSAIRMRYNIPPSGLPLVSPKLKIRALVFGLTNGPLPAMTMRYRRIARPIAGSPTPILSTWTSMTWDIVTPSDNIDGLGGDLPLGQLIEVESSLVDIAGGDTVLVELARAANAQPDFANDVGVLRIGGITLAGG